MSKMLIVSYDLNSPGKDYTQLVKKLKSLGGWAKLGGSAYLLLTAKSAVEVRDALVPCLDKNDQIFVGSCPAPSAWAGLSDEVARWIHKNQTI